MREDPATTELKAAIRKRAERPADERFNDLVQRGVIDGKGKVLIRVPDGPEKNLPNRPESKTRPK